ncbi:VOC family protein [Pseudonocardia kunmingensis]|uniref:VOC domain-containing protein n=1 Tax=Pseudonocardia kunmingensis TaxID=630975 RepID=A0A543CYX5_9PSEU|nr:VOC family protein [Pseudonocardia kunmingensis]TQM02304.1 hypothetical protein FB558_8170 [Pseudonocardia kunmingensis]
MTTNHTSPGRVQAVVLDSERPAALAEFYRSVLGGEITESGDDYVALAADGVALAFQVVADGGPPAWPHGGRRLHLDVAVPDLDAARARLVELGARVPDFQPGGGEWIVLLDPEGHPCCIAAEV